MTTEPPRHRGNKIRGTHSFTKNVNGTLVTDNAGNRKTRTDLGPRKQPGDLVVGVAGVGPVGPGERVAAAKLPVAEGAESELAWPFSRMPWSQLSVS